MINWVWTLDSGGNQELFSCIKSNQIPMYQTVNKEIMGPLPKPGPLSDCWCMWELNKWWGLSGGKITEENLQILSSHGFQDNRRFPRHVFSFIQLPAPFTRPHHQSFSCLPNNAHLYASVIKTQPITIPEQLKRYHWAFQFDNFGHLIQKIELGPRRQDNVPEKIFLRRLCVSLLTSDGFLVISEGFLDPTLVRPRHHLHHIPTICIPYTHLG